MKKTKDEVKRVYDAERQAAMEILRRTFGQDGTVPLDVAGAILPVLPEYRRARAPRR